MKPEKFKLTEQDRNSDLWARLKEHIEGRIEKLRSDNDKTQAADATEKLRGRIAELKTLLALDKDSPQVSDE